MDKNIRIEIRNYNGNEIIFQENFFGFKQEKIDYILGKIKGFLEREVQK